MTPTAAPTPAPTATEWFGGSAGEGVEDGALDWVGLADVEVVRGERDELAMGVAVMLEDDEEIEVEDDVEVEVVEVEDVREEEVDEVDEVVEVVLSKLNGSAVTDGAAIAEY